MRRGGGLGEGEVLWGGTSSFYFLCVFWHLCFYYLEFLIVGKGGDRLGGGSIGRFFLGGGGVENIGNHMYD